MEALSKEISRKTIKIKKNPTKAAQQEEFTKPNNENPDVEFPLLTPTTQKYVDFNKKTVYDFDLWEMDGQCLIASVAENSYSLHCLDTKKNNIEEIKREKIELVVSPPNVFKVMVSYIY